MRTLLFAVATLIAGSCAAAAQSSLVQTPKEIINVGQGTEVVLQASRPFSSVIVADPEVADALPRSDRMVAVIGKNVGLSDIVLFSDAQPIHHVTIHVTSPPVAGKVIAHNRKDLSTYTAYQCSPVCNRIEDKHENRKADVVILGPAGAMSTNSTTIQQIFAPPASTPQAR